MGDLHGKRYNDRARKSGTEIEEITTKLVQITKHSSKVRVLIQKLRKGESRGRILFK
jgi:hypothetical protein